MYLKRQDWDAAFCAEVRRRTLVTGDDITDEQLVKVLRCLQDCDVTFGIVCSDPLAYVVDAVQVVSLLRA